MAHNHSHSPLLTKFPATSSVLLGFSCAYVSSPRVPIIFPSSSPIYVCFIHIHHSYSYIVFKLFTWKTYILSIYQNLSVIPPSPHMFLPCSHIIDTTTISTPTPLTPVSSFSNIFASFTGLYGEGAAAIYRLHCRGQDLL